MSAVSGQDLELLLRVVLAGALGYLVGLEREYVAHREAGSSTFGLIAMASALVTALSLDFLGIDNASRVIANVVVGVGFLGGGVIVKEPREIKGLTTAAGIWAMATIGIVVGTGRYGLGVLAAVLVLLLLSAEHLEKRLHRRIHPGEQIR
jgi:putative Mg2+ transporter-C (MgtC) family protein